MQLVLKYANRKEWSFNIIGTFQLKLLGSVFFGAIPDSNYAGCCTVKLWKSFLEPNLSLPSRGPSISQVQLVQSEYIKATHDVSGINFDMEINDGPLLI